MIVLIIIFFLKCNLKYFVKLNLHTNLYTCSICLSIYSTECVVFNFMFVKSHRCFLRSCCPKINIVSNPTPMALAKSAMFINVTASEWRRKHDTPARIPRWNNMNQVNHDITKLGRWRTRSTSGACLASCIHGFSCMRQGSKFEPSVVLLCAWGSTGGFPRPVQQRIGAGLLFIFTHSWPVKERVSDWVPDEDAKFTTTSPWWYK